MKIVSGMRPTGKLHLGHYLGVLKSWLSLQKDNEVIFFVADWHALSTSYEDKLNLKKLSISLVKDWLASGIDGDKATIFIQSSVKEHSELYLLLNMITPLSWLERNPTYKDQLNQMNKDIQTAGFLTYPVLQASDIILYGAEGVPIGEDQRPHLEITREIVRRFHYLFSSEIFKEPQEILSETPKLLGLDGRKMSKSYNNGIYLNDNSEEIWQKIRTAKTDTNRVRKTDKGNPNICLVFDYHKEFSDNDTIQKVKNGCETGTIGCIECKKFCFKSIEEFLTPIRERYLKIDDNDCLDILEKGRKIATKKAKEQMKIINRVIFER